MSIFVSVEDREGESLDGIYELRELCAKFGDSGQCLAYIRETTDTSFNPLQQPALLAELEQLAASGVPATARPELDRLIKTCRRHADNRNAYVRFYGEPGKGE